MKQSIHTTSHCKSLKKKKESTILQLAVKILCGLFLWISFYQGPSPQSKKMFIYKSAESFVSGKAPSPTNVLSIN